MDQRSIINELHELRATAQLVIDSTIRLEKKKIAAGMSILAKTRKTPLTDQQITRLLANHLKPKRRTITKK